MVIPLPSQPILSPLSPPSLSLALRKIHRVSWLPGHGSLLKYKTLCPSRTGCSSREPDPDYVPYQYRYPKVVPRPRLKYVSWAILIDSYGGLLIPDASALFAGAELLGGGGRSEWERTESHTEIEHKPPSEHLKRTVSSMDLYAR
jgi:hypothetical protein